MTLDMVMALGHSALKEVEAEHTSYLRKGGGCRDLPDVPLYQMAQSPLVIESTPTLLYFRQCPTAALSLALCKSFRFLSPLHTAIACWGGMRPSDPVLCSPISDPSPYLELRSSGAQKLAL